MITLTAFYAVNESINSPRQSLTIAKVLKRAHVEQLGEVSISERCVFHFILVA